MQNDTISRSKLIADLECFKLQLGDIILGFVVDRVVEIVQAQPAEGGEEREMPELKPCPFCGGDAEICGSDDYFWVTCTSCCADVLGSPDKEEAVERWNRRVCDENL
jgi:Lar family restriction alleviation protein